MFNAVLPQDGNRLPFHYDADTGDFIGENGVPLGFQFDPVSRTFKTVSGFTLELKPVNSQTLLMYNERLRQRHEPKMPQRAIEYEEGKYFLEGNPQDPWYVDAVERYELFVGLRVLEFLVASSVRNPVPDEDRWTPHFAEQVELVQPETRYALKFLWVSSLMGSDDEIMAFLRVVQGQTLPTQEGIEQAEARFQGDGRGDTD